VMLGTGLVFRRAPLAVLSLLVASTAIFAAATVTYPRIGEEGTGPWTWWEYVRDSRFIDTLTVELGGPGGWLSVFPFVLALAAVVAVAVRTIHRPISRFDVSVAAATVAAWLLVIVAASAGG
jgi:hypothetical protein